MNFVATALLFAFLGLVSDCLTVTVQYGGLWWYMGRMTPNEPQRREEGTGTKKVMERVISGPAISDRWDKLHSHVMEKVRL